jgi:6-phosphofructokinase 1
MDTDITQFAQHNEPKNDKQQPTEPAINSHDLDVMPHKQGLQPRTRYLSSEHHPRIHRLAVLTSGGDAPGMNAAIKAVVDAADLQHIDVIGFMHGFNGIFERDYVPLTPRDVKHIIHLGGTILKSARCKTMHETQGPSTAAAILHELSVDALVIIGGDGSFRGATALAPYYHGQIIGIPGTIDNDIDGSDYSIGFATAVDTALDAIDKIRDTADAFERIFLVEVMGRHSGYLAMAAGIASAAEQVICPELHPQLDLPAIAADIRYAQQQNGKQSYIIVVAEQPGLSTTHLADELTKLTHTDCRACVLGHLQRGGSPVFSDRILATKLGHFAVQQLLTGAHLMMAGEIGGVAGLYPLHLTGERHKSPDPALLLWQQQQKSRDSSGEDV